MSKEVKTPEYWNEERFQPLVETETMYGTKVMVPENLMPAWRFHQRNGKSMLKDFSIQELAPDTWNREPSQRDIITRDLRKVFYEVGKEN